MSTGRAPSASLDVVRPVLRPGAALLRRDAQHLQVGISPGLVVRDRPGLMSLLRLLDGVRSHEQVVAAARVDAPEIDDPAAAIAEMVAGGLVQDAAGRVAPGTAPARRIGRGRRSRRHQVPHPVTVSVVHDRHTATVATLVDDLLVASGLRPDPEGEVRVVLSHGETGRSVFDAAMVQRVPHVRVVLDEDVVRIGPFVDPGRTPCTACHDRHRADWDPAWSALVPQFGRPGTVVTPPTVAGTTLHVGAAALVDDLVRHASGLLPRSAGRCVGVGPSPTEVTSWAVGFHPACPCTVLVAA